MTLRLRIAHRAASEIEHAERWWLENRPAAPGAFRADLKGAFVLLRRQPGTGARIGNMHDTEPFVPADRLRQPLNFNVGSLAMARNVEIKARIASVEELLPRVAALASEGPIEIAQQDTFFLCESGRLKLRDFLNGSGELIFYRRANQLGPKESFYLRSATSTPEVLKKSLSLAYGDAGSVSKERTLFLVGRTRVHLDRVQGLGHFLELEVVLGENEASEVGTLEAHELMSKLGIEPHQLLEGAYVELLAEKASSHSIERAD